MEKKKLLSILSMLVPIGFVMIGAATMNKHSQFLFVGYIFILCGAICFGQILYLNFKR